jgi:hypothetical protein
MKSINELKLLTNTTFEKQKLRLSVFIYKYAFEYYRRNNNLENIFLESRLNEGYTDIADFYQEWEKSTINKSNIDSLSKEDILFNCEFFLIMLYEYDSNKTTTEKNRIIYESLEKIILNTLKLLDYELVLNNHQVGVIKKVDLENLSDDEKIIKYSYYDYKQETNKEHKAMILALIARDLEPFRLLNNGTEYKSLYEFFFKILNTYHIRHNNENPTKDIVFLGKRDSEIIETYDMTFNVGISLLAKEKRVR